MLLKRIGRLQAIVPEMLVLPKHRPERFHSLDVAFLEQPLLVVGRFAVDWLLDVEGLQDGGWLARVLGFVLDLA